MNAPRTAPHGQDTTITGSLYVAFELGDRNWKLSLGDGVRSPSNCTMAAGDAAAVLPRNNAECDLAWLDRERPVGVLPGDLPAPAHYDSS